MTFRDFYIRPIKEETSKEDKLAALRRLAEKSNQYIVLQIRGTYFEAPRDIVDSFGRKKTSWIRSAKHLKLADYQQTTSLHEYHETVLVSYNVSRETYNSSRDALREWLIELEAETGDELTVISNPSKDVAIAVIVPSDLYYRGSSLCVAFPRNNFVILSTLLESINLRPDVFINSLDGIEDELLDSHTSKSRNHLAKYFLDLPGNQEPISIQQG